MLAGFITLATWQERRERQRQEWVVAATNAELQAQRYTRYFLPGFITSQLRKLFSQTQVQVRLRGPEQFGTLKQLAIDGPTVDSIILQFDPQPDQVLWLRSEFPRARLLQKVSETQMKYVAP